MSNLVKRANAALEGVTKGPWETSEFRVLAIFSNGQFWEIANAAPCSFASDVDGAMITAKGNRKANARFIAEARQLVPEMAARISELEALVERAFHAGCAWGRNVKGSTEQGWEWSQVKAEMKGTKP
jgi:hypothetical protein